MIYSGSGSSCDFFASGPFNLKHIFQQNSLLKDQLLLLPVFPSLRHDSIVAHHARGIPASDKQILLRVKEGLKQRRLLRRISAATANAVIFLMRTSLIKFEKCQQPGGYFYQSEINFFFNYKKSQQH